MIYLLCGRTFTKYKLRNTFTKYIDKMTGKAEKKTRGQNFTLDAELKLCTLIANYKKIIENKCTNKVSTAEKVWNVINCTIKEKRQHNCKRKLYCYYVTVIFTLQEDAWKSITNQFNASSNVQRDTVQLKAKYDNLKSASKKYAQRLRGYTKTGGGPSDVKQNPVLDAVLEIINKKNCIRDR